MKKSNNLKLIINIMAVVSFILLFLSGILRIAKVPLMLISLGIPFQILSIVSFFEMITLILIISIVFINWFVFGINKGQNNSFYSILTYWISLIVVLTILFLNLSFFAFSNNLLEIGSSSILTGLWEILLSALLAVVTIYTLLKNRADIQKTNKEQDIQNNLNPDQE
ncbi:hypothetical protein [Mycoplasmopsis glycophila]|uniref:Uncharacterized protein n=1 Tax=Mycoplasmopsis glycophila TaxID=171285 RepID=A0A449AV85_9BACT|nr:hypothetical protein [Mycoplasmopsis glycophila]VEU70390.1 Uncharacterised protein [Mycoplasmopsis glycophila]